MQGGIKVKVKGFGAVWVAVWVAVFAMWVAGCQRGEEAGGMGAAGAASGQSLDAGEAEGREGIKREEVERALEGIGGKEWRIVSVREEGMGRVRVCALCVARGGWVPRFFICERTGEDVYATLEGELDFGLLGRKLSAAEAAREMLRKKMAAWESSEGEALAAKVARRRADLEDEVAAIELAGREGLAMVPGYGDTMGRRLMLETMEGLSDEEYRERMLEGFRRTMEGMVGR